MSRWKPAQDVGLFAAERNPCLRLICRACISTALHSTLQFHGAVSAQRMQMALYMLDMPDAQLPTKLTFCRIPQQLFLRVAAALPHIRRRHKVLAAGCAAPAARAQRGCRAALAAMWGSVQRASAFTSDPQGSHNHQRRNFDATLTVCRRSTWRCWRRCTGCTSASWATTLRWRPSSGACGTAPTSMPPWRACCWWVSVFTDRPPSFWGALLRCACSFPNFFAVSNEHTAAHGDGRVSQS